MEEPKSRSPSAKDAFSNALEDLEPNLTLNKEEQPSGRLQVAIMFNFKHAQNGAHSDYNGVFGWGLVNSQITNGTAAFDIHVCKIQCSGYT